MPSSGGRCREVPGLRTEASTPWVRSPARSALTPPLGTRRCVIDSVDDASRRRGIPRRGAKRSPPPIHRKVTRGRGDAAPPSPFRGTEGSNAPGLFIGGVVLAPLLSACSATKCFGGEGTSIPSISPPGTQRSCPQAPYAPGLLRGEPPREVPSAASSTPSMMHPGEGGFPEGARSAPLPRFTER
jgi:hypothetical protein